MELQTTVVSFVWNMHIKGTNMRKKSAGPLHLQTPVRGGCIPVILRHPGRSVNGHMRKQRKPLCFTRVLFPKATLRGHGTKLYHALTHVSLRCVWSFRSSTDCVHVIRVHSWFLHYYSISYTTGTSLKIVISIKRRRLVCCRAVFDGGRSGGLTLTPRKR